MDVESFRRQWFDRFAQALGLEDIPYEMAQAHAARRGRPLFGAEFERLVNKHAVDGQLDPVTMGRISEELERHARMVETNPALRSAIRNGHLPSAADGTGLARLTRGSAVIAGIGLIGHGLYAAAGASVTDERGKHRHWGKTAAHLGEAVAGAGLTWVAATRDGAGMLIGRG